MNNLSQTQIANFTALAGIIVFVANQLGFVLDQSKVVFIIAGLFTIGGIIYSTYNRYKKGDITLGGKRK